MPAINCKRELLQSFYVEACAHAHGVANNIKCASKRERRTARLAAFDAQVSRTGPATSLAAPVPCSPAASRAQVLADVAQLLWRCADERSGADVRLGRLLRA